MAEKILQTRILNKIATLEAWNSSTLKIKNGEICFATVAASAGTGLTEPVVMAKIGTSEEKTFSELPWSFYAKASDVLAACKSEESLKAFVNSVIADADIASDDAMQELAGKVAVAEGEIDTLQTEMDAVEAKAAANETAIATLNGLVGDTKVADQINTAIANLKLADTYAAKVHTHEIADVNGLSDSIAAAKKAGTDANAALEAYKTLNDAAVKVNSDAIAAIKNGETLDNFKEVEEALAGKQAAGNYSVEGHKHEIDDVNGLSDAISAAQKAGTDAAATAETNAKAYADGLAVNYDAAGSAATAEQNAKDYTDSEMTRLVGDTKVATQISDAITALDLSNTYAAKSHTHVKADITDFAHTHEISEVTGLQDALDGKQAVGDYATKAEAQGYADAKDAAIEAAQAAADQAQEEVDALETYVGTIPDGYTETNVIAYINKKAQETLDTASGGSSESVASVLAALNTYKAENDPKVNANTEAIAALEELVGDEKVSDAIAAAVQVEKERAEGVEGGLETRLAAVESDYLKQADKTALQDQITTNANAIELLTNGVSADEVDGVNDLIQYVKDHGTEVTGMKNDIKANADAIDAIEADYLKAADKTELSGLITGLDTRMGAAETAIGTKAAQADLEALDGRVTTVEGKVTTLEGEMDQAQADIDALELKVGDETVAKQIEDAITALKIGDYAKAADLTAAIARISQNETDIADLKTRMGTAEGDIDNLETEVAKKANDADLAAIAKTGSTDDLVQGELVLVFDCGGAE